MFEKNFEAKLKPNFSPTFLHYLITGNEQTKYLKLGTFLLPHCLYQVKYNHDKTFLSRKM